jgi:hypothetical protein
MIWTDCTAFCGPHLRRPIGLEPRALAERLAPLGIERICASRLEALWFENPHDANRLAESMVDIPASVIRIPVIDPTLATWRDELDRLSARGLPRLIRLHPNYHGYSLSDVDPLLDELAKRRIVAQVVVRLDDPRRQHPKAQVADVHHGAVRDAAFRHPTLKVLLSGATASALKALTNDLAAVQNLWADTTHADGVEALQSLAKTRWRDRLVLGSQAPILIAEAAVSRVVLDLDDAFASLILGGNAETLIG